MKEPKQGDIYWLKLDGPTASGFPHPHVVIEIEPNIVTLCALTTNMKKVSLPGNILLEIAEANLPKQSIVDVSQAVSVEKAILGEYVGSLSGKRIQEIFSGMKFLQKMSNKKN